MVVTFRQGSGGRFALPVRVQDSSDLPSSLISVVVHDHCVETIRRPLLLLGLGEAALDRGGVVLTALEEPAPLVLPRWGLHEDEHRIGVLLAHGEGALDVHLEEDVVAGRQVVVDRRSGRAFQVAVHLEPLEEPALVTDPLELPLIEKQVVLAVGLTGAARPRGRRNREPQARFELQELANDRPLADPGRAREDQQDAQGVPPISRSA
jgi:hypothetical protein